MVLWFVCCLLSLHNFISNVVAAKTIDKLEIVVTREHIIPILKSDHFSKFTTIGGTMMDPKIFFKELIMIIYSALFLKNCFINFLTYLESQPLIDKLYKVLLPLLCNQKFAEDNIGKYLTQLWKKFKSNMT